MERPVHEKNRPNSTGDAGAARPHLPAAAGDNGAADSASNYRGASQHDHRATGGDHCGASADHRARDATGQYPKRPLRHRQCCGDR